MTWNSWHMSGIEKAVAKGFFSYSQSAIRNCHVITVIRKSCGYCCYAVAPMDEHGYFNFGPSASHLGAACERAKTIIVEVNKNMPRCLGGFENGIHISKVDMIIEGSNPPIAEMGGGAAATEVDHAVARQIVAQIQTVPAFSWELAVCQTLSAH